MVVVVKSESESEVALCVRLFAAPRTVAYQAPPSIHGILQARILDGLPFPSPGDLPDPVIEPKSPTLGKDALTSEPPGKPLPQEFWQLY